MIRAQTITVAVQTSVTRDQGAPPNAPVPTSREPRSGTMARCVSPSTTTAPRTSLSAGDEHLLIYFILFCGNSFSHLFCDQCTTNVEPLVFWISGTRTDRRVELLTPRSDVRRSAD